MKKTVLILVLFSLNNILSAQFVARVQLKEEIPGICDQKNIYALFPSLTGQVEAVSPISKSEIIERLNRDVTFLKSNPKYKGEITVSLFINCKGEMVQHEVKDKSKNKELESQIAAVFKSLNKWEPGTLNGEKVDSNILYSLKIKKGKIFFD